MTITITRKTIRINGQSVADYLRYGISLIRCWVSGYTPATIATIAEIARRQALPLPAAPVPCCWCDETATARVHGDLCCASHLERFAR